MTAAPQLSAVINQPELKQRCVGCWARQLAICGKLSDEELAGLAHMTHGRALEPGKSLFHEGDDVTAVYTVNHGMLKLYKLFDDRRQIVGFTKPGQFLGLASNSVHSFGAEAITEVEVCSFPKEKFLAALDRYPVLSRTLLDRARNELAVAYEQMLLLGRKTAQERVASLILAMSGDGDSSDRVEVIALPMTRHDIADYLGLTLETVSRVFTQLKRDELIRLPNAHLVEICDRPRLEHLAKG